MQRFRKYIDKDLNTENVKNLGHLNAFGITGKHLPDPPEELMSLNSLLIFLDKIFKSG